MILLGGCAGGDGGARPASAVPAHAQAAPRPALCSPLWARVTGRVSTPAATELSGLALSRSQPGVLWTHNDSGDSARVFALAADGRLRAQLAVPGATNVDWEEITIGRRAGADTLYVGDIGDNLERRPQIVVYAVPEPRLADRAGGATAPPRRIVLRYPDGPHDAEALLVDPLSGALVVVTKSFNGEARVYSSRPRAAAGRLRRVGRLSLGGAEAITAGSISADERTIALRSYDRAYVWTRGARESLAATLRRAPCIAGADLIGEGQGEALALTPDGRAFYTVPEGSRPAIRRYAARGPSQP